MRRQTFQLAKPSAASVCKKENVAAAIAAFARGYHPGQKAIVKSDGLPKLTRLLTSALPDVQDKALSAMLVRDISQMHICMMPICAGTPGSTAGCPQVRSLDSCSSTRKHSPSPPSSS